MGRFFSRVTVFQVNRWRANSERVKWPRSQKGETSATRLSSHLNAWIMTTWNSLRWQKQSLPKIEIWSERTFFFFSDENGTAHSSTAICCLWTGNARLSGNFFRTGTASFEWLSFPLFWLQAHSCRVSLNLTALFVLSLFSSTSLTVSSALYSSEFLFLKE